jgi:hypothetical protein
MKCKNLRFYFLILFLAGLTIPNFSWAGGTTVPSTRSTATLKKYMSNFGAMMAGLEIMRLKEKKPDWEVINLTLKEMSSTLEEMQRADAENAYKEYTDVLASGLTDLKQKASTQNKKFYDSLDKMSDTCFKCHAAHRPGDYLTPGKDRISEFKPLMK